jgi:hypothetical protein
MGYGWAMGMGDVPGHGDVPVDCPTDISFLLYTQQNQKSSCHFNEEERCCMLREKLKKGTSG